GSFWRWRETLLNGASPTFFREHPVGWLLSFPFGALGFLGVPLFFVISGFCIHLPQARKPSPIDVGVFTVRRTVRLYPTYALTFSTAMLLLLFKGGPAAADVTWTNFVGHLFFWYNSGHGPGHALGIPPVLWSISLEIQF